MENLIQVLNDNLPLVLLFSAGVYPILSAIVNILLAIGEYYVTATVKKSDDKWWKTYVAPIAAILTGVLKVYNAQNPFKKKGA